MTDKDFSLEGDFDDFEKSKKGQPKKRGRKPLEDNEKTEQYGIRMKESVWVKFKLILKELELEALKNGEKEPTQGDVFEKAIDLLKIK